MGEIKVTIVIPIYNPGDYLYQCLDSIIGQNLQEIEVILINDGSTDDSLSIIKQYAEKDSRFTVIDKGNDGTGFCRNIGIRMARGEYIAFVDSDDFIDADGLAGMYETGVMHNLEIVVAGHRSFVEKGSINHRSRQPGFYKLTTGKEYFTKRLYNRDFVHNTSHKIYKRDFLISNNLYFIENVLHEDFHMNIITLLKAERLMATDIYYYNVNDVPNSITRRKNREENGISMMKICYSLEPIIEKEENPRLRHLLKDHLASMFMFSIDYGNIYNKKYKKFYTKKFLIGKAGRIDTGIKVFLFLINKRLYKFFRKINAF